MIYWSFLIDFFSWWWYHWFCHRYDHCWNFDVPSSINLLLCWYFWWLRSVVVYYFIFSTECKQKSFHFKDDWMVAKQNEWTISLNNEGTTNNRVTQGNLTPTFSQNRAWKSPFTRLFMFVNHTKIIYL